MKRIVGIIGYGKHVKTKLLPALQELNLYPKIILSNNIDLNLNDPNKELVLWFNKSLVYPRPGYPGKGAIVPGGGRLSECRPMIAYHGPDVPQRWKIEKKHMMVFQSI